MLLGVSCVPGISLTTSLCWPNVGWETIQYKTKPFLGSFLEVLSPYKSMATYRQLIKSNYYEAGFMQTFRMGDITNQLNLLSWYSFCLFKGWDWKKWLKTNGSPQLISSGVDTGGKKTEPFLFVGDGERQGYWTLEIWPCSIEYRNNTKRTCFFLFGNRERGLGRGRHEQTGRWMWMGCMMWIK